MIKLKNKEYPFKFGLKAMLKFEELTGKSATELGNNVMIGTVIDLCYCGIVSAGGEITRDQIIDAIDEDIEILNKVSEMIGEDMAALSSLNAEAKK